MRAIVSASRLLRLDPRARCVLALVILTVGCSSATAAFAAGKAQLSAGFAPEKLGTASTLSIGFRIGASEGPTVTHLTSVDFRLPSGVTNGLNTLGPETCTAAQLELGGLRGCPANSLVGTGSAVVSVRLGAEELFEPVNLAILMAPAQGERTELLFYSTGTTPVISQLVFQADLLGDSGVFGALIEANVPPIPALPDAPDAALIGLEAVIAPKDLIYHKREHGVIVAYKPVGFFTPPRCPHGGFPFAATFTFASGARESATTRVPCPRAHRASAPKRR
jgi:hypothetical protein